MKKLMLICAPVTSRSGYGAHARDLTHAFIKHDKYDVKIMDVPWGDCPRNALNKNNNEPTMNNTTPTVAYSINAGKNKVLPKKKAHADMIFTNALTLGTSVNFITIPYSVNSGIK